MTLLIAVYVPAGIALAADSRLTATRTDHGKEGDDVTRTKSMLVLSDATNKLVELKTVDCAVGLFDGALLEGQPIDAHIERFEEEHLTAEDDVGSTAQRLHGFLRSRFPDASVGFTLAGYRVEGRVSVPHLYAGHTKRELARPNLGADGTIVYGVTRSGDTDIPNRLINKDSLPRFDAMPLQDAVDYAVYLIRTTIDTLRFEPRHPTVGGPIDVMTVTSEGCSWISRKDVTVSDPRR
jgi:hypothetical protein